MTDNVSPDEPTIVAEILRRIQSTDRHALPSHKVKLFLQMVGDELQRAGVLEKDYVDHLVRRLRSGEL